MSMRTFLWRDGLSWTVYKEDGHLVFRGGAHHVLLIEALPQPRVKPRRRLTRSGS